MTVQFRIHEQTGGVCCSSTNDAGERTAPKYPCDQCKTHFGLQRNTLETTMSNDTFALALSRAPELAALYKELSSGRVTADDAEEIAEWVLAHLRATDDYASYAAPDPYEHDLAALRAAQAADPETPESRFEQRWRNMRMREFALQQAEADAYIAPPPRLTAAEEADLATYEPPDPYAQDLERLRAKPRRRL